MAPTGFWRSALLSPLLVAGVGCGGAGVVSDEQPALTSVPATVATVPTPATPATPPAAASGTSFTAPDGRFSARFPAPPERGEGSSGDMTFVFYAGGSGGRQVSVGFVDYPKRYAGLDDERMLLRQMAEEDGMLSQRDGTFLGRRSLDIVVPRVEEGAKLYLHEKSYLVGNRMYFLRGWSTNPAPTPDHATLISTFKLTG